MKAFTMHHGVAPERTAERAGGPVHISEPIKQLMRDEYFRILANDPDDNEEGDVRRAVAYRALREVGVSDHDIAKRVEEERAAFHIDQS